MMDDLTAAVHDIQTQRAEHVSPRLKRLLASEISFRDCVVQGKPGALEVEEARPLEVSTKGRSLRSLGACGACAYEARALRTPSHHVSHHVLLMM